MASTGDFQDRTVVVTGAGGRLGSALVALLAERGARVIGCDTSIDALTSPGLSARHVFDLTDSSSIHAAAQAIIADAGAPDVLINNAGWTRAETLTQLSDAVIDKELDLNLTGVMRFSEPMTKAMAARGSGSVVFVSSVNALAHFGNPAYAAAKAGINAYARAVAVELGRSGYAPMWSAPARSAPMRGIIASQRTRKSWVS